MNHEPHVEALKGHRDEALELISDLVFHKTISADDLVEFLLGDPGWFVENLDEYLGRTLYVTLANAIRNRRLGKDHA
jgi:hypothetical protein